MARKTIEQRIAELEVRKKTLMARLGKRERAEDTRRKILLGALVLYHLQQGKDLFLRDLENWLRRELPGYLSRDQDRILFPEFIDAPSQPGPEEAGIEDRR
ncbi:MULTISPECIES: mobilization protein [unclassified Rhizobium]|uniref:mobilization protein n=1 Tax=unclassified Rhizobium TaxID=2613769 RepID=UPI00381DABAC